jgi:hypothetical protein
MWAINSKQVTPEVMDDIKYWRMAKEFGFTERQVREMSHERVETYLFIEDAVNEKEERDSKHNANNYKVN